MRCCKTFVSTIKCDNDKRKLHNTLVVYVNGMPVESRNIYTYLEKRFRHLVETSSIMNAFKTCCKR